MPDTFTHNNYLQLETTILNTIVSNSTATPDEDIDPLTLINNHINNNFDNIYPDHADPAKFVEYATQTSTLDKELYNHLEPPELIRRLPEKAFTNAIKHRFETTRYMHHAALAIGYALQTLTETTPPTELHNEFITYMNALNNPPTIPTTAFGPAHITGDTPIDMIASLDPATPTQEAQWVARWLAYTHDDALPYAFPNNFQLPTLNDE